MVDITIGIEKRKGNDMPKKKTVYKKGAQNFDSFKSGKNERLDPRFKHYEIDPDEVFETALDVMEGNETDELRAAEKERERRAKISASNRSVRADGRAFEEMLIRACDAYKAAGKAMISKVPESRRVVGRTGGRKSGDFRKTLSMLFFSGWIFFDARQNASGSRSGKG